MTISLPAKPDITLLKKQAKKLLKQHRASDPDATNTVNSLHPKPEKFTGLRDAQLVVARSYGFKDWARLSEAVELANHASTSLSEKADLLIQLGCVQYSGSDTLRNYSRANALLTNYPDVADVNFYTAVVCHNKQAVQRHLKVDPRLATSTGGPLNWPALLYATYSRIDEPAGSQDSIEIVRMLMDHGADPDSHVILNDTYRFTALTGAMGEGEQGINQPPHQHADELALILLKAGAFPNDGQGLYNTMFTDSGEKWLQLLISHGLNISHKLNWNDSNNDSSVATLDYLLVSAINHDFASRVRILLTAGADPNTVDGYKGNPAHTIALLRRNLPIAELLEEFGATVQPLSLDDRFRLACVNADEKLITTLLDQNPLLKTDASLLHDAADNADTGIVRHLLALGFDINAQSDSGRTLLHKFAMDNNTEQVRYLLENGADVTIRDTSYQSTPAGFAAYTGANDALHLLLDHSNNFFEVVCCAYLNRARVLLSENPKLARQRSPQGYSALHIIGVWLAEEVEYANCKAFIELLLAAGADINALDEQGQTPVDFNRNNGAETLADILGEYSG